MAQAARAAGEPVAASPAGTGLQAKLAKRLPLALWLLITGLSLAGLLMILVTLDQPAPDQWGIRGNESILALAFGSVGALITARRPGNRVGWLILLSTVPGAIGAFVTQYPVFVAATGMGLGGVELARWTAAWIWAIGSISLSCFMPLIFPTGRLLSSRWRAAVLLGVVALALQLGMVIATSQPIGPIPPSANPARYFQRYGPVMFLGYGVQIVAVSVAVVGAVVRFRRAGREEREQIKWVVLAGLLLPFSIVAGFTQTPVGQAVLIGHAVFAAAVLAIAILRYRLYEIDLILNRTLVYGALTAVLAGVYTASITLSQRLFSALSGEKSDAAIVFTTLVVVTLFTPIKTRLQAIVDARLKPPAHTAGAKGPAIENGATADSGGTAAEAVELIRSLSQLRDLGAITRREYETKKAELLARL